MINIKEGITLKAFLLYLSESELDDDDDQFLLSFISINPLSGISKNYKTFKYFKIESQIK